MWLGKSRHLFINNTFQEKKSTIALESSKWAPTTSVFWENLWTCPWISCILNWLSQSFYIFPGILHLNTSILNTLKERIDTLAYVLNYMKWDPNRIGFKLHVILIYEQAGKSVKYIFCLWHESLSSWKQDQNWVLQFSKCTIPNTTNNIRTNTEKTKKGW